MPTASSSKRVFFDTNILVYTDDCREPSKQQIAVELVKRHRRQGTGVVSIQVLQEYFVIVTGKYKVDVLDARRKVETISRLTVAVPNADDVFAAIDLHRLHQISFWDALIVRMARQSGCNILLTEDLQNGQSIDGVMMVNPFLRS